MEDNTKASINFHQMELDDRILKAIAKLGWITPTLIQEKAIPLILDGKDVLIHARTGSGKTASFSLPIIQKLLNSKQSTREQNTKALILGPSKELCFQLCKVIDQLTIKCSKIIKCVNLTAKADALSQKYLLSQKPEIIVSTPARILSHMRQKNIDLKDSLEVLVMDECDLLFSYGFEEDIKHILQHFLPSSYQSILASATLNGEVMDLKKIVLHNAVTLKLEEPELPAISQLSHYYIPAEEDDKAAILYTLFKLFLLKGKSIIFVNNVDKCYKLKLFLDQFNIRSSALSLQLPVKMRCHTVQEFNRGAFDIIIASDEHKSLKFKKFKKNKILEEVEFGVSRGIDFQHVSNVINFDFPLDMNSYVHRAGRTARGNNSGNVLSFVSNSEQNNMNLVEEHLVASYQNEKLPVIQKHVFKTEDIEPFKYRAHDAWYAVTKSAVREARLKEIKKEIFNSEKLKTFFENSPKELQVIRHDAPLNIIKTQQHLAEVPDYIIPAALKNIIGTVTKKRKHISHTSKNIRKTRNKSNNALSFNKKKRKNF